MRRSRVVFFLSVLHLVVINTAFADISLTNQPYRLSGKYLPYEFFASGSGNTTIIPSADVLVQHSRIPYAIEWIDGATAPTYPLTVVMASGSWELTWTLTSTDKYQFYFDAAGDSGSPPTITGAVTVTVTAAGQSPGGLGPGEGTLKAIFW